MIYTDIHQIDGKYNLILADPPWKQTKGGKRKVAPNTSGVALDYPTLSLADIKDHLKYVTENCADDNCIMFLWTIEKYLFEAEQILKDLGYKIRSRMIWDKMNGLPVAFTIRFGHEYLLYAYKGKMIPVAKEYRGKYLSVFHEPSKRHSQKPEYSYEMIENLYPNLNKLEMYARRKRLGWDSFGNELVP